MTSLGGGKEFEVASKQLPEALQGLEPASVWHHFYDLTQIPRCSGNEAAVRAHIERFAAERGVAYESDEAGNVLLRVRPEAKGPSVCLQGHMDMVCVAADGVEHDFAKDPIALRREGDSLFAQGTTLGADNGIGVAYGLAMIDEPTGPLEILCTADEEQGLTGASNMRSGWLKSRFLVNLDSEEEQFLTVACSGGRDYLVSLPLERVAAAQGLTPLRLAVKGLQGGHSGIDINLGRSNAIQVLARLLAEVEKAGGAVFEAIGGVKRNAIPPQASARFGLPAAAVAAFRETAAKLQQELRCDADPELLLEVKEDSAGGAGEALSAGSLSSLIHLLEQLPHGVQKTTEGDPSQPYVSVNLALVEGPTPDQARVVLTGRSPSSAELEQIEQRLQTIAAEHGARASGENGYPGWEPNYDSPLLATTRGVFTQVFGTEPKVLEIHAGLECGIIGAKHEGLDMISIGPDLHYPHSPREHVSIPSVERIWNLLRRLVAEIQSS